MESPNTLLSPKPSHDYSSLVDTSRPFRSVKEAVAIFGERILVTQIYSPKPYYTPTTQTQDSPSPWMYSSAPATPISTINPNKESHDDQYGYDDKKRDDTEFYDSLKKLENELEQTKEELKLLKERESETEIAVASLNAELHKNMSKMAEAEAIAAAKKAEAMTKRVTFETDLKKEKGLKEEEKRREMVIRMEKSSTLANILSIGEEKLGLFKSTKNDHQNKNMMMKKKKKKDVVKKKPIIPLVGDLFFFRKKGNNSDKNNTVNNPLFASSHGVF